jgi:hypothetical protein
VGVSGAGTTIRQPGSVVITAVLIAFATSALVTIGSQSTRYYYRNCSGRSSAADRVVERAFERIRAHALRVTTGTSMGDGAEVEFRGASLIRSASGRAADLRRVPRSEDQHHSTGAIHYMSSHNGTFVTISCAASPIAVGSV